jgi:hypothetical protein
MKRNRFLLLFSAVSLLSFGTLAGCDADEDPILGNGSGNGSGSGSGDMLGGLGDACTDGSECESGICEGDVCVAEPAMDPYLFVAVVSTATGADAIDNNTPGPDIDAIQLVKGGNDNFATAVESFGAGAVGADGNVNDDASLVVGPNDAIPAVDGSEDCNLAEVGDTDPSAQFHSLGGDGGYVVVSFATGIEVEDGNTINVWELADTTCNNVDRVRPDSYNVFIGTQAALDATTTAADISAENGWALVTASSTNGGIVSVTASIPEM